jgi:hypothetical protein
MHQPNLSKVAVDINMEHKLIQSALVAQRWFMQAFFVGVSLNK